MKKFKSFKKILTLSGIVINWTSKHRDFYWGIKDYGVKGAKDEKGGGLFLQDSSSYG
jgi:hypothetical protein